MAKLVIKSGSQAGREIELAEGLHRLGRHPSNDLHLPEPSVSNFHCELKVAEIGVAVRDLQSTNGTFINQAPVTQGMLQGGDLLTVGQIEMEVLTADVKIALPAIPSTEAPGAAFLSDGTLGCFTHREAAAVYRCVQCEHWWCAECVRVMKRLSGDFLQFCPECSGPCVLIPKETGPGRKSFLERVGDTLRMTRKGK